MKMSKQQQSTIHYAEFCAGVGGFRLGIEASSLNAKIVHANEIDAACARTYSKNFGHGFDSSDLLKLNPADLPDFDMLCAGFPCQPFSIAGKCLGFDDPRGNIFSKLASIIDEKQPQIVFLENVANLVRHNGGRTYASILKRLDEIGYSVSSKILDSSFFGVPQSRRRVYIVGFNRSVFGDLSLEFTEKKTERTALRPFVENGVTDQKISDKWNAYVDLYCGRRKLEELAFDVPKSRRSIERIVGHCDIADCVLQIRSSGVRALSLDEPFPTFTVLNSGGGAHVPILTKERRRLSLVEMKRIMGFPDDYDFTAVSRTDAAKQLANAVCPPVISSICDDIKRAIFERP